MNYPLNCWYLAAWAHEVPAGQHLARTIAEKPLLLWHGEPGQVTALLDRCPHRFAPLSRGRFDRHQVACGYHGVAFDVEGRCTANPHGPIVPALTVQRFPTLLKHRGVWVWLGDAAKADPSLLPDLSLVDELPETAQYFGLLPVAANYLLCADNICDLSHGDYLHPAVVGGGAVTQAKQTVREENGQLIVTWQSQDIRPIPIHAEHLPEPNGRADMNIELRWNAPGVMWLYFGSVNHGKPAQGGVDNWAFHIMMPQDEKTTLYFYWLGRGYKQDDAQFNDFFSDLTAHVFSTEDKPMLVAQQERIGAADFDALQPVLLRTDQASVWMRRQVKALIEAERGIASR